MKTAEFDRAIWAGAHADVSRALEHLTAGTSLIVTFNWPIFSKTISEIGGRLLEDWLLCHLQKAFEGAAAQSGLCHSKYQVSPVAAREIGDVQITFEAKDERYRLFLSIKTSNLKARDETLAFYKLHGIAKKKPGESHPNLIAIERALAWYSNEQHVDAEIALLHVKYTVLLSADMKTARYVIQDDFMQPVSASRPHPLMLVRDISEENLSTGALGKGQLQLHRLANLKTTERTKAEFVKFVREFQQAKQTKKVRLYR